MCGTSAHQPTDIAPSANSPQKEPSASLSACGGTVACSPMYLSYQPAAVVELAAAACRRCRGGHRDASTRRAKRGLGAAPQPSRLSDADPDHIWPSGLCATGDGDWRLRVRAEGRAV